MRNLVIALLLLSPLGVGARVSLDEADPSLVAPDDASLTPSPGRSPDPTDAGMAWDDPDAPAEPKTGLADVDTEKDDGDGHPGADAPVDATGATRPASDPWATDFGADDDDGAEAERVDSLIDEAPIQARIFEIELKDGQLLRGTVDEEALDGAEVEVALSSGHTVALPRDAIRALRPLQAAAIGRGGEIWLEDPNRTRYLYAPSAMMLRQGEGHFSQKELFFSSLGFGITDNVSLQVGSVLPMLAVPEGLNAIVGIKVGHEVAKDLHLAAGAQALLLPMFGSFDPVAAGFGFGAFTWGNANAHLTLALGRPFVFSGDLTEVPLDLVTTLNAAVRLNKALGLVAENWVLLDWSGATFNHFMLNSAAVRVIMGRFSVDLGLIHSFDERWGLPIPIPWLDFSYSFG